MKIAPLVPAYTYRAVVTAVHDGDTFSADIDLGMHVWLRDQKIRLLGINAPELAVPDGSGVRSQAALSKLLHRSKMNVVIQTHKDGKEKFGRWLGLVFATTAAGNPVNVNVWLVFNHFATAMP